MWLATLELWLGRLVAVAGLGTLAVAVLSMLAALRRPTGREERGAHLALRAPILVLATGLFIGIGALAWGPLPVPLTPALHVVALLVGTVLLLGGLALYLWGLLTLGNMFGPSSGFGVRLYAAHRLVTTGPFACLRHPMYLSVMVAAAGSLVLYRTWTTLGFAVTMLGLVVRARREERVLAQAFGAEWDSYAARVPMWFPRPWGRHRRPG